MIKLNQNAWLKPYIDMNTDLRKVAKNNFGNNFFKLMNHAIFGKTMGNMRKQRDIKLIRRQETRNYLVSEPNSLTKTFYIEHFSAIEMKKRKYL